MDNTKVTIEQFGATIKQKYPEYSKYSDTEIGTRMLQKYPQYQSKIVQNTTIQPKSNSYAYLDQPHASYLPPKEEKPGFIQSVAQTVAQPFLRFGNTLGQLGNQVLGINDQSSQIQSERNAATGSDYGYFGRVTPIRNPEEAVGTGLQIGSMIAPVGQAGSAIAKSVLPTAGRLLGNVAAGSATGALNAGLYSAGQAAVEDQSLGDVVGAGVRGGAVGAALGGAIPVAGAIPGTVVKLGKKVLGATTGAGESSITQAVAGSSAFRDAMRGKTNPNEVVEQVKDLVQNIKADRGARYTEQLAQIGENTTTHDISPVKNELESQLKRFNVKVDTEGKLDFSRSAIANNGTARGDIQGVYETVTNWGKQTGDDTGVGLDILKRQLDDFYSPSGQARAFVQGVKGKVSSILQKDVPGYQKMVGDYAQTSALLDDIKSATGVGGKAKDDTIFTKLTTAMRADKEFRIEMLSKIQQGAGDPTLMQKIAGINMSSFIPRGIIGRGIDASGILMAVSGAFNPKMIPVLLSTSPRFVGEVLSLMGLARNEILPVLQILRFLQAPAGKEIKNRILQAVTQTLSEQVANQPSGQK